MRKMTVTLVLTLLLISLIAIIVRASSIEQKHTQLINVRNTNFNKEVIDENLDNLKHNPNFIRHEMEFKETNEEYKINRQTAIESAEKIAGPKVTQEAKKITAIKVKLTHNQIKKIPNTNIVLQDYPVWVVTFHGVTLDTEAPQTKENSISTVYADMNVFIDANSGEDILIVSHTSLK